MLITDRQSFDAMLRAIETSETIAADTEADGLHLRHGNKTIGISVYTSSDSQTWYFAWRHGFSDLADADYEVHKRWSIKKRAAYAQHIYNEQIKPEVVAENMPVEWLEDLKAVWLKPKLIVGHNLPFDLTAFSLLGFPTPAKIADTMSMLAVVTDWRGNPAEGILPQFRMPDTGELETGSRGLKWHARLWNLIDAKEGIDSLETAVKALNARLQAIDKDANLGIKDSDAAQGYLWMVKPSDVARYAEDDVRLTYLLYEKLLRWHDKWKERHVSDLFNDITLATWQMSNGGIPFNHERAAAMIETGDKHFQELQDRIRSLSGGIIENPASPTQVLRYFHAIGLDVKSTGKEVLKAIRDVPIVGVLSEFRSLKISLNDFVKKWYNNAVNGRIYPQYNVGGTSSGRLSSSSEKFGNGQNMPRVTAKSVVNPKMTLYPPTGMLWISIDYTALEVYVGAWVAETVIGKGKNMTQTNALLTGADMHTMAMQKSGIDKLLLKGRSVETYLRENGYDDEMIQRSEMTPDEYFIKKIARPLQKNTNFASQYNAGAKRIANMNACSYDEAVAMLNGFHTSFPAIRQASNTLQELAMTPRDMGNGSAMYVRYPIPELSMSRKFGYYPATATTKDGGVWSPRKKAAGTAFNAVVQGTGGLIMLKSIIRIKDRFGFAKPLDNSGDICYTEGIVYPLSTVHDSFCFGLRPCDIHIVPEMVSLMTDWPVYPPLKAAVSAARLGESWGEEIDVVDIDRWIASEGTEFH